MNLDYIIENIIIVILLSVSIIFILFGISKIILEKIKSYIEIYNRKQTLDREYVEFNKYKNTIETKIEYQKAIYNNYKNDLEKLISDSTINSPWLAQKIADLSELKDTQREQYLKWKDHPAEKASNIVTQIKKEKKELIIENKSMKYQLDFIYNMFPWVEDALENDINTIQEAVSYLNNSNDDKSDYEIVSNYLSPEEYKKMSDQEKYQLALDRYLNRKNKSLWEIGISYERYIGYTYEMKGYKVYYTGATQGLEDLGRDLIVENEKEIIIIQCKYWRKEKLIRENAIMQLYGTVILKQLSTKKMVKGILVTTTTLSDTAKLIAKELGIIVREQENFNKTYPCIKCNINPLTHEKIYHLPFDQQYDRICIEVSKGETYVSTVKEAENLGYRKALKHYYQNK